MRLFGLAGERDMRLMLALGRTRLVLIHRRVHAADLTYQGNGTR